MNTKKQVIEFKDKEGKIILKKYSLLLPLMMVMEKS
jgi:hypothetical protein